ncbi:MAG: DUF1761 domain-containing protein [Alphaproteobacteria bacterium]|nr:MAG: DUF1761 domain-containing protein [Alphaproteobacteria bacterium]
MGALTVILAAAAAWIFGALWYGLMGKAWMEAAGLDPDKVNPRNPRPYLVSAICLVLVAGMMRHMFAQAGIDSPGKGFVAGLGIGLFLATPWIVTNYSFAGRPAKLSLIDGVYATGGSAIAGLVLTLL